MLEYTNAFLKAFKWAKSAYDFTLALSSQREIKLGLPDLTAPIINDLPDKIVSITTDRDWNLNTKEQDSILGSLYASTDQAEDYILGQYSTVESRLTDSERRVQKLETDLVNLQQVQRTDASTSIHISGGEEDWVDKDPEFYIEADRLASDPKEKIFRLKDTGSFSSIRSLGGFAGVVVLEKTLGHVEQIGTLDSIVDGDRNTFWMGTVYAPAPLRADNQDVPWLPNKYKHGSAIIITYYLDRPTVASEVYIEPVTTAPFDLVGVCWTPIGIKNQFDCFGFESSGCAWEYFHNAERVENIGLNDTFGILTYAPSGWASETFAVAPEFIGHRIDVRYHMKGEGDLKAGSRIVWLDNAGSVVDYKIREDFPPAFFAPFRIIDTVPPQTASGRIDFGIFTEATPPASGYFDGVQAFLGENCWYPDITIDKPTTVPLPEPILSNRISFILAQRNPRREVLARAGTANTPEPITGNRFLDPTTQKATEETVRAFRSRGPGNQVFAYRIGIKELDLRYREYLPHGRLVSKPIVTGKEIRKLWVIAGVATKHENDVVEFFVYPFGRTTAKRRLPVTPFTSSGEEGSIIEIYTPEESNAGWVVGNNIPFLVNPERRVERFDGTDRDGKVRPSFSPHVRKVKVLELNNWLAEHSIWPTSFDPNAANVYGFEDTEENTIRETIRKLQKDPNSSTQDINLSDMKSIQGYLPVKVTVSTDRWTAFQDTKGRPDRTRVRSVSQEVLDRASVSETEEATSPSVIDFAAWLNSTIGREVLSRGELISLSAQLGRGTFRDVFGREVRGRITISSLTAKTLREILDMTPSGRARDRLENRLRTIYEKLKAQGKLEESGPGVGTVITTSISANDVFKTRFKPIVTGEDGTLFRLWWYNPDNTTALLIAPGDYGIVDYNLGTVKVLRDAPGSGFTQILADYKYLSFDQNEDHFSSVISLVTAATGIGESSGDLLPTSRSLPITRNMTDYTNGIVPDLRPPNFDKLSRNYYPVIEYYVTTEGEIVFSRDFFRFGDIPAEIIVEYETLGLSPRVAVEVTRSGNPATSPQIGSITLRSKERTSSPIK